MNQKMDEFEKYKEKMKAHGLIPFSYKWGVVGYLCVNCGQKFYSKRRYVNKHPYCRNCMRASSYGEKAAIDILVKNHVSFQKEKTFRELKGKGKAKLRFDFYIQNPKGEYFIIEIDGEQHYMDTNWFNQTNENDRKKDAYCIDHNIRLYRVIYKHSNVKKVSKAVLAILYEQGFNVEKVESNAYFEVKEKGQIPKQKYNKNKNKKYYAIKKGRKSNVIVTDWTECKKLVYGYSNCRFKSFDTIEQAERYLGKRK